MPPAAFLKPNKVEQARIKAKQDDAERAKKAEAKVKAAERKRKRAEDAEKVSVSVITQHIVRTAHPETQRVPAREAVTDRAAAKVKAYLESPPYFGRSELSDKDRVKELCGEGHRVWDKDRKMWGTRLAGYLENLINSRKWAPFGIEDEWLPQLVEAAKERVAFECAHAEAAANVKWDNSNEEIKAKNEAEGSTAHLNIEQRAAQSRDREADDMMLPATLDEVKRCAELGFVEKTIAQSRYFSELGPRAGLSDEGRLLRWVDLAEVNVRYDFELQPDIYFDPIKLQPFATRAVAQLVQLVQQQLNERASLAASAR